ncbi:catechol 1,2-dioxygenase [Flavobacterium gawalongense]|uniref:catechol 1,2-dioxygenase n=1 Tax=Flavobacterium gawalongense TaxID=2594432 RepID=A0A553BSM6_9FLAO|nr:catechol 1,2-dioxygenase [Flavobacterium gawalongense]TRX03745.1 catechol 1,2-dioxygenase [Flavobacterium gawalongense]TRX08892.1 catechol 1,2-dioxygenase [Flavobacterium gawalongense]TRX11243.1 catechol 1,2-dioxygenase [Flavobacterium gawalongense]TRX12296.1 catechol 1,2-dioxygenase [Flavobacterium gawalongense]TRX30165.1 catechol 1,2-dioxygenase [Flavobacterium gawalongense]
MTRAQIDGLLQKIESTEKIEGGSDRAKAIVNRILRDLFYTIEDLDIQPDEVWTAVNFLTQAGQNGEYGLIAAGLGLEHFLDLRMDEEEEKAGMTGGTPRTIEGPLYVAGAPKSKGFARLDDGTEAEQGEIFFMQGKVLDDSNNPIPNAIVEVWHANLKGNYSYFDQSQSDFNLRRTIETDENGNYQFRSILPSGYAVPPGGSTETLLSAIGRHGNRPSHVHFFVSAPGCRKLTTQINFEGDPYLWDDFAFATREGLVPDLTVITDAEKIKEKGLDKPFSSIDFDFTLHSEIEGIHDAEVERLRAESVA